VFQRPRRFASRRASRSSQLKTGHSIAHPSDRLEDHLPRGRKDGRQILRHLRPGHGVGERSEPDLIAPPGSSVIVILPGGRDLHPAHNVLVWAVADDGGRLYVAIGHISADQAVDRCTKCSRFAVDDGLHRNWSLSARFAVRTRQHPVSSKCIYRLLDISQGWRSILAARSRAPRPMATRMRPQTRRHVRMSFSQCFEVNESLTDNALRRQSAESGETSPLARPGSVSMLRSAI